MGYARAGFDVIGVDLFPQPRYPFKFVQMDALEFLIKYGDVGDLKHASPPCHDHTTLKARTGSDNTGWLLAATRTAFAKTDTPWVLENVMGPKMNDPLILCGTEFGLVTPDAQGVLRELRRHRQFESNEPLIGAGGCRHNLPVMGVYGTGGGGQMTRGYKANRAQAAEIMDIEWMDRAGLSQAIPPVYAEHIGRQLMAAMLEKAA